MAIGMRIMLGIGAAAMLVAACPASPVMGRIVYLTDGDTFRLETGERIRIAGIDTAEMQKGNAKCARELVIGAQAKRRAIALLKDRTITFGRGRTELQPHSCKGPARWPRPRDDVGRCRYCPLVGARESQAGLVRAARENIGLRNAETPAAQSRAAGALDWQEPERGLPGRTQRRHLEIGGIEMRDDGREGT